MLSLVPPELLRLVIEKTVTHTFHSTAYYDRQATLRSLCLVSRVFRDIAQPLLFQIVFAQRPSELERTLRLAERKGLGNHIREFVAEVKRASELKSIMEGRLSQVWSSLSSLTLDLNFPDRVPWSTFSVLSNLRHLHISSEFPAFDDPVHFPYLCSLVLHFSPVSFLRHVLDPTHLPAIRALSVLDSPFGRQDLEHLRQSRFVDLVLQLEVITVDLGLFWFIGTPILGNHLDKVLVDAHCNYLRPGDVDALPFGRHLRVFRLTGSHRIQSPFDWEISWLSTLAATIAARSPSEALKSLYLDTAFEDVQSLPPVLQDCMVILSTTCAQKKVELVFERDPRRRIIDTSISEDFWRRQREKKRQGQE